MARELTIAGVRTRFHEWGAGRATLLLHGFLADTQRNWAAPGIAERLARTRRVIAPDFFAHGESDPLAALAPMDALPMQAEALLAHLGVSDYDLVGYSMGARTAVRMLARGQRPGRCVLGGMGGSGVTDFAARQAQFEAWLLRVHASDDPASHIVAALLGEKKADDMIRVLRTQVSTSREALACIETPILVVSGAQDNDNGSAEGLAAMLPNARAQRTPGSHLTAVAAPEFADAIVAFLG